MRAVVQRVREAKVEVDGRRRVRSAAGLLVLLGVAKTDTRRDADYMADKLTGLRIFPDEAGKMNRDVMEAGGSLLVVSQFTLYGDVRRGRRPGLRASRRPAAGPRAVRVLRGGGARPWGPGPDRGLPGAHVCPSGQRRSCNYHC